MVNYNDLRPKAELDKRDCALVFPDMTEASKKRTIENLFELKKGLKDEIPDKRVGSNLLVASWNLKDFGSTKQKLEESFFYIAEIINSFDLVAIQELNANLSYFKKLIRLLGDNWGYMINDVTEGDAGNDERSAYLYNKNRVDLGGLAGEVVLWKDLTGNDSLQQLKRTPFMTGFKTGWKTFAIINLHLHPGNNDDDIELRKKEVAYLLEALKEKKDKKRLWTENLIIIGDMNLYYDDDDETVALFNNANYREVESLIGVDTTVAQSTSEAYDRFFIADNDYFQIIKNDQGKENGGVFDPFKYVLKLGDESIYKESMLEVYGGEKDMTIPENYTKYYKNYWRKNQISDHYPIWFELNIDSSQEFLIDKLNRL